MLAALRMPSAASRAHRHLATRSLLSFDPRRAAATLVSRSDADPAASPKPKRISPYRLVPARTFLSVFAPLHAQGWRLNSLKGEGVIGTPTVEEDGDLQDYELVRTYGFEMHKDGWRRAVALVGRVGEVVEQQDVSSVNFWA